MDDTLEDTLLDIDDILLDMDDVFDVLELDDDDDLLDELLPTLTLRLGLGLA